MCAGRERARPLTVEQRSSALPSRGKRAVDQAHDRRLGCASAVTDGLGRDPQGLSEEDNVSAEVGWADPEMMISKPRVQRVAGFHYLYVEQKHIAESDVGWAMGELMPRALEAYLQGREGLEPPPMLAMYIDLPDEPRVYDVEVGYAFRESVSARGGAQVRYVEPALCAGLLVWGTLDDILKSYGSLMAFVEAKGLMNVEGWREWYLYWEDPASRNNVTLVQHVVEEV